MHVSLENRDSQEVTVLRRNGGSSSQTQLISCRLSWCMNSDAIKLTGMNGPVLSAKDRLADVVLTGVAGVCSHTHAAEAAEAASSYHRPASPVGDSGPLNVVCPEGRQNRATDCSGWLAVEAPETACHSPNEGFSCFSPGSDKIRP